MYPDRLAMCEVEPGRCSHACRQRCGKCPSDQGRHEEAAARFKSDLAPRREAEDVGLIAWSKFDMEAAEARPGAGYPVDAAP